MTSQENPPESEDIGQHAKDVLELTKGHKYEDDPKFLELSEMRKDAISAEGDPNFERHHKAGVYIEQFRETHPDFDKYVLFRVLVGSSAGPEQTLLDTEDHQLENFIRSL